MSMVDLLFGAEVFRVSDLPIRQICTKFPTHPVHRRTAFKAEKKQQASFVIPNGIHLFSGGMSVSNNCDSNLGGYTSLDIVNTNKTGLEEDNIFASLDHFHVTEIEVFEITNYRGAKKS
jgi:hypothetical protein